LALGIIEERIGRELKIAKEKGKA